MGIHANMFRNRRVEKEISRSRYTIVLPEIMEADVLILGVPKLSGRIKLGKDYPFSPPKLYIDDKLSTTILITRYKMLFRFINKYDIPMRCVCCEHLAKRWVPTYVLDDLLDEYVLLSKVMAQLLGYKLIIHKLPFDSLVHTNVLSFLSM